MRCVLSKACRWSLAKAKILRRSWNCKAITIIPEPATTALASLRAVLLDYFGQVRKSKRALDQDELREFRKKRQLKSRARRNKIDEEIRKELLRVFTQH
jgi:hypothetical protein